MRVSLLVAVVALSLIGCPKANSGPNLGGSDDQTMDSIASKLEEYRTQNTTGCGDLCSLKTKVCGLSQTACDIAASAAERAEYQKRCVTAQEDCARFNEACSSCKP
jgi:hypothetical protein